MKSLKIWTTDNGAPIHDTQAYTGVQTGLSDDNPFSLKFAEAGKQYQELLIKSQRLQAELEKVHAENIAFRQQIATLNGECQARYEQVEEYQAQNRALIASNREESTIAERILAKADSAKALAYHLGNILDELVKTSLKEGEAAKNEPRLPLDEEMPKDLQTFLSAPKAAE